MGMFIFARLNIFRNMYQDFGISIQFLVQINMTVSHKRYLQTYMKRKANTFYIVSLPYSYCLFVGYISLDHASASVCISEMNIVQYMPASDA